MKRFITAFMVFNFIIVSLSVMTVKAVGPPAPLAPVPKKADIDILKIGIVGLIHFGLYTFNEGSSDGSQDPNIFQPMELDCNQWVAAFKGGCIELPILVTKHGEGFCLWLTSTTHYSVGDSITFGRRDVCKEFAEACDRGGVKHGFYMNTQDWHLNIEGKWTKEAGFNELMAQRWTELLTKYGTVTEAWAGDGNPPAWVDLILYQNTIRRLQPDCRIFSDNGPDLRWSGNEEGFGWDPHWSMINDSCIKSWMSHKNGEVNGNSWCPAECDSPLSRFWQWIQGDVPISLRELTSCYYDSVGNGCIMDLGVPPDNRGLILDSNVKQLKKFGDFQRYSFKVNYALGATATATQTRDTQYSAANVVDGDFNTYWAPPDGVTGGVSIELDLGSPVKFDVLMVQEYIELGQRVTSYMIEKYNKGIWSKYAIKQSIGFKKLIRIPGTTASKIRLTINSTRADGAVPCIREIGVYKEIKVPGKRVFSTANPASLAADGASTALITAELRNSRESILKTATNAVTFSLFGNGTLIGPTVKNAVNGVATVVLQTTKNSAGRVVVVQTFSTGFSPYAVEIGVTSQTK